MVVTERNFDVIQGEEFYGLQKPWRQCVCTVRFWAKTQLNEQYEKNFGVKTIWKQIEQMYSIVIKDLV